MTAIRVPLHMNPLMKALSGNPQTNFKATETVPTAVPHQAQDYQVRPGRASGHVIFRRQYDGTLDFGHAVGKIVIALRKFKLNVAPLTEEEALTLSVCFPAHFNAVAPGMEQHVMSVKLGISMVECLECAVRVGEFLAYERAQAASLVTG